MLKDRPARLHSGGVRPGSAIPRGGNHERAQRRAWPGHAQHGKGAVIVANDRTERIMRRVTAALPRRKVAAVLLSASPLIRLAMSRDARAGARRCTRRGETESLGLNQCLPNARSWAGSASLTAIAAAPVPGARTWPAAASAVAGWAVSHAQASAARSVRPAAAAAPISKPTRTTAAPASPSAPRTKRVWPAAAPSDHPGACHGHRPIRLTPACLHCRVITTRRAGRPDQRVACGSPPCPRQRGRRGQAQPPAQAQTQT